MASEAAALDAFVAFSEKWEQRYPAIVKLWDDAWAEFLPTAPTRVFAMEDLIRRWTDLRTARPPPR